MGFTGSWRRCWETSLCFSTEYFQEEKVPLGFPNIINILSEWVSDGFMERGSYLRYVCTSRLWILGYGDDSGDMHELDLMMISVLLHEASLWGLSLQAWVGIMA